MLSKTEFQFAFEHNNYIIGKLRNNDPLTNACNYFLKRWSVRSDTLNHSSACLIDRQIQVAVWLWKNGKRPQRSAYLYNCEVVHHMRDYRGMPSVHLQDEDQWDDMIKQPKIVVSDNRYMSDLGKHVQPSNKQTGIKRKGGLSREPASKKSKISGPIKPPMSSHQIYSLPINHNPQSSSYRTQNRRPRNGNSKSQKTTADKPE